MPAILTADLIASTGLRFFLGLFDQPLTPEEQQVVRRRHTIVGQDEADPIQVATAGRMFVVVARGAALDPDWSEASRVE